MSSKEFAFNFTKKPLPSKEVAIERKFQRNKIGFQMLCLKVLCLVIVSQSTAIFYFNPLQIDLFQTKYIIIHTLSIVGVLFTTIIISRKYPHLSSCAITTIVVAFIVGASEYSKIIFAEKKPTPMMFLMMGINFQTGCLFLIISRIRWIYNMISLSLLQIYIWIRAIEIENNSQLQTPVLITLALYVTILPYFCYAGELEDRKIFASMEKLQEYQKGFEDLLRNVIPSAIFMIQGGKISFFNKTSQKMFQLINQDDISPVFAHMQVRIKIK